MNNLNCNVFKKYHENMSGKAHTEVENKYYRKYYTALDTIIVCIKDQLVQADFARYIAL